MASSLLTRLSASVGARSKERMAGLPLPKMSGRVLTLKKGPKRDSYSMLRPLVSLSTGSQSSDRTHVKAICLTDKSVDARLSGF